MCDLAGVSRAGFYRYWEQKAPAEAETALRDAVHRAALANPYYGYRRIAVVIQGEGFEVGRKRVRTVMRNDNLLAIRRRKFVVTTDSKHGYSVYANLAQHVRPFAPNQLWVADMTYIRLRREFVYLAVLIDVFSRRVVGQQLGRDANGVLALAVLNQAIEQRKPGPNLVHHSDQGAVYASKEYVARLESIGGMMSMSRAGRPWENGVCESFIRTLKKEEVDARPYATLEELEQHLEEFIRHVYNRRRLHSALGYVSPEQFEEQWTRQQRVPETLPLWVKLPRTEEVQKGPAR
jgi:transposase InsO family protein